jgi:hypothetical protein
LEKESARLAQDLNVVREAERLEALKRKKEKIKTDLESLIFTGKPSEKVEKELKEVNEEVWICEAKLKGLLAQREERIEPLRSEIMSRKRAASEIFVRQSLERIGGLEQQLKAEAKTLLCAAEIWMRNQPFRLQQVSSKKLIVIEREVVDGGSRRTEKDVISLMTLPRAKAVGWRVVGSRTIDDKDLTLEPPDASNSISVPTVPQPEIVARALQFGIVIDRSTITISDEDVLKMESEIEKEEQA